MSELGSPHHSAKIEGARLHSATTSEPLDAPPFTSQVLLPQGLPCLAAIAAIGQHCIHGALPLEKATVLVAGSCDYLHHSRHSHGVPLQGSMQSCCKCHILGGARQCFRTIMGALRLRVPSCSDDVLRYLFLTQHRSVIQKLKVVKRSQYRLIAISSGIPTLMRCCNDAEQPMHVMDSS